MKKILIVSTICIIISGTYLYTNNKVNISKNIKTYEVHSEAVEATSTDIIKIKDDLIIEIDKENTSLQKENNELRAEINKLKKEFNYIEANKAAKFYAYTVYNTFNNRYHSTFNENFWNDGTEFKVDGKVYTNGIGFDRTENGDRSYYVAKLYNTEVVYSKLTGLIGVDDLAKELSDSQITFKVFNNDDIIKCNNEYFGDELYSTNFKMSDGLQEIDINLEGANNIIVEFSIDKNSDMNYILLLNPELK